MFGAPAGGDGSAGHQGSESRQSRPIRPPKSCVTSAALPRLQSGPCCRAVPVVWTRGGRVSRSGGAAMDRRWSVTPWHRVGIVVLWCCSASAVSSWPRGTSSARLPLRLGGAAVGAESASLWTFAYLQQRVLRLGGRASPMPGLFALTLANDAIANTVPGEPGRVQRLPLPLLPAARGERRERGLDYLHDPDRAGDRHVACCCCWASSSRWPPARAVAGRRRGSDRPGDRPGRGRGPVRRDLVLRLASAAVRGLRRASRATRAAASAPGSKSTLARMREIPLSRRSTAGIVALAAAVWFCDFLCLLCGFGAVHCGDPVARGAAGLRRRSGGGNAAGRSRRHRDHRGQPGRHSGRATARGACLGGFGRAGRSGSSASGCAIAVGWISVAVIARHLGHDGRGTQDQIEAGERGWPGGLVPDGPASVPDGD